MPSTLHATLKRQLKRHWGNPEAAPPEWRPFLRAVSETYREFDKDRGLLERSLELTSEELIQANTALRESEMRYRTFLDADSDLIFLKDEAFRHLFINRAYGIFLGRSEADVIGRTDFDLMPQEMAAHCRTSDQAALNEGASVTSEETVGANIYQTVKFPVLLPGGRRGVGGYIRDITEYKRAEAALRESEHSLREAQQIARIGSYELDVSTGRWTSSAVLDQVFGIDPTAARSMADWTALIHPDDRARMVNYLRDEVFGQGQTFNKEYRILRQADQIERWVHGLGKLEFDARGRPRKMFGTIQDITERKQAERLLQESEERFQQVAETAKEWIWEMDAAGVYTYSNSVVEQILGYKPEELVGKMHFYELFAPHVREEIRQDAAERTARKEAFRKRVNPIVHKDGHIVILETTGMPILDRQGRLTGYRGADTDITERKQIEEHLRFHAQLLNSARESVVASDLEGRIRYWGRGAEILYGYKAGEVMNQPYRNFAGAIALPDEKAFWQYIIANGFWHGEHQQRKRNGEIFWSSSFVSLVTDEAGRPSGFIGIDQDITERKRAEAEKARLEAELQQAQKMESVGRLAGGVAHDFNNMLGVILGRTELALEQTPPSASIHADLEEIRRAAARSADLTRQLLAFARKQTVAPRILHLNETIAGMLQMLKRLIGENIDLAWRPQADLWPVRIDPAQIDQILANLCVNARDAIAGTGKIAIETGNVVLDQVFCADHAGFAPGEYAWLTVSDNGCGMTPETLAHVFEPFFTTKEIGEGTGLGLSTVYGIVKQNNGFISVSSERGLGTLFKIYLPRHVGKAEQIRKKGPALVHKGHETILLVEDEPAIRNMTQKMLERQGYQVLAATTPGEAIHCAREHAGEIHLLMTDVVMPEMNGRDLAKNLLALYPRLKCLFMSGYPANVIAHHGVLDLGVHFIQKPFTQRDLFAQLRKTLDPGGS